MALASPGTRLTARIIDLLVVMVLGTVLSFVLGSVAGPAVAVVVAAVYETAFIASKGQTPGKVATRIRIVRAGDGFNPGWGAAAGRWALPAVASVAQEIVWAVGVESDAVVLLGVFSLLVYVSLGVGQAPPRVARHDRPDLRDQHPSGCSICPNQHARPVTELSATVVAPVDL